MSEPIPENDDALRKFEDMFNQVSTDVEAQFDQDVSTDSSSQEPFDEAAKKLLTCEEGHSLEGSAEVKVEEPAEVNVEEPAEVKAEEPTKAEEAEEAEEYDAIPLVPMVEVVTEVIEEKPVEKPIEEQLGDHIRSEFKNEEPHSSPVVSKDGKVMWSIESPSSMYREFYERKRELIEMTGEQLNFDVLNRELKASSVNVTDRVFDKGVVIAKMEQVQGFRERVKNIYIDCSVQYFLWKRWIEKDLLRGYLARVNYIKPAIKQEGLVLEHMRDIEFYFARLESLYSNCAKVEKTLEAAYELLSRKASICTELKVVYKKKYREDDFEVDTTVEPPEFDEVPMGGVAKKTTNKTGVISWGDM